MPRDHGRPGPGRARRRAVVLLVATAAATLLAATVAPTALAVPTSETWAAELSIDGGDDSNVAATDGGVRLTDLAPRATSTGPTPAEGELLLAPRRPAAVTDRVAADVTADVPAGAQVVVAVRGIRSDGTWGQWSEAAPGAPATLSEPTYEVQVRVTLVAAPDGTGPVLQRLWLTADQGPATPQATPETALTAQVYATRIGLVGNSTANGHEVQENDRFVALPSRRGLSPRDTGDYTVRVCSAPTRCTWAPVWDLGPWNTTDDYWSPPAERQAFGDLPRGRPEAEAAYTDGYNGGRDRSGRQVTNPAGIDLADGTFREDLGMQDNGWVTVTYLWTGTGPSGTARQPDERLTVRAAPNAEAADVGTVAPRARVAVECATAVAAGGRTAAPERWLRLGTDQYVPADAIEVPDVPAC
jgi:hypothetical protein